MIPLGMILALILEVCLYVWVCAWVWNISVAGLHIGMVVVLAVTVIIVVRVLMVPVEFALAWLWRVRPGTEARIGFWGEVRLVVTEMLADLIVSGLFMPWCRVLVSVRRGLVTSAKRPPVLLIHGFAVNAGIWAPLLSHLWGRGLTNLFTINLRPVFGDIDDYAQQVAARVSRICESTRSDKVILVGHSTGGLIARACVTRHGGADHVEKVISIGAPHHGTKILRFLPGRLARQMSPRSPWLRQLNQDENRPTDVAQVSIYSTHDNLIIPHTSAEFGKAKNLPVAAKGHFTLIFCKEVGQLVYREITEG